MNRRQFSNAALICLGLISSGCLASHPDSSTSQDLGQGSVFDGARGQRSFQLDMPVSRAPFKKSYVNWKQRIDQPYVYVEFIGSYTETGRLLPLVHRAMADQGIEPSGPPFNLYFDDPGTTATERLRSRACVPVEQQVRTDNNLAFDLLPSTTVVYAFVAGAYPEVPRSYPSLYEFMLRSDWVENGPIRETYLVAPDSVQSFDDLITEVQVPVTYAP